MRAALVTSQVNFVRDNYEQFLNSVLSQHSESLSALVIVRTLSTSLILKIIALFFMGCPRLAFILARNVFRALRQSTWKEFRDRGIPIHFSKNINDADTLRYLQSLDLDLIINARTRNIYKKEILDLPRWGCINLHHGLLPENRGAMCDLWALSENRPVGFTIHWMNSKLDDGLILLKRTLNSTYFGRHPKDYSQLPYFSSLAEAESLSNLLHRFKAEGKIEGEPNRAEKINFTRNPRWSEIRKMREVGVRL